MLETFVNFSFPVFARCTALIVGISAAIGEVGLALSLLIIGTKKEYKAPLKPSMSVK